MLWWAFWDFFLQTQTIEQVCIFVVNNDKYRSTTGNKDVQVFCIFGQYLEYFYSLTIGRGGTSVFWIRLYLTVLNRRTWVLFKDPQ